jgi:hypothetical protein
MLEKAGFARANTFGYKVEAIAALGELHVVDGRAPTDLSDYFPAHAAYK